MNPSVDFSRSALSPYPVAIIGSGGRLGGTLMRNWKEKFPLVSLNRSELDLADAQAVEAAMRELVSRGVRCVVNASGMTSLEICEEQPDLARRVNAEAVQEMARICAENGIRLMHFSTDYVFDGKKERPYLEEDAPGPLSVYGESKLEGERAVLEADGGHLVFRVAWVFGPGRPAFPDMVIRRALDGGEVAVVADKWASPTSAEDVADWLLPLVLRAADPSLPGGLFHLCNSGVCSWMDYAVYALETARDIGLGVSTTRPQPLALADMKMFRAPRPVHSGMNTAKFQRAFGISPRSWQEGLRDYILGQYSPRD